MHPELLALLKAVIGVAAEPEAPQEAGGLKVSLAGVAAGRAMGHAVLAIRLDHLHQRARRARRDGAQAVGVELTARGGAALDLAGRVAAAPEAMLVDGVQGGQAGAFKRNRGHINLGVGICARPRTRPGGGSGGLLSGHGFDGADLAGRAAKRLGEPVQCVRPEGGGDGGAEVGPQRADDDHRSGVRGKTLADAFDFHPEYLRSVSPPKSLDGLQEGLVLKKALLGLGLGFDLEPGRAAVQGGDELLQEPLARVEHVLGLARVQVGVVRDGHQFVCVPARLDPPGLVEHGCVLGVAEDVKADAARGGHPQLPAGRVKRPTHGDVIADGPHDFAGDGDARSTGLRVAMLNILRVQNLFLSNPRLRLKGGPAAPVRGDREQAGPVVR